MLTKMTEEDWVLVLDVFDACAACLSSDARCNTPGDLISARLINTLRSRQNKFQPLPRQHLPPEIACLKGEIEAVHQASIGKRRLMTRYQVRGLAGCRRFGQS